ncbi:MAG TPA: hypothetical protein VFV32_01975 [Acidimicrobiales bacterium]|nr:hypothetical protein [Acidimicrobiales bacterium]
MCRPRSLRLLAPAPVALAAACSDQADDEPIASDTTERSAEETTSPQGDDAAELPSGWHRVTGDGVSLGVPEDWKALPEQMEQEATTGLEQVGATLRSTDRVDTPGGTAVRVAYAIDFQGPDSPVSVEGGQF